MWTVSDVNGSRLLRTAVSLIQCSLKGKRLTRVEPTTDIWTARLSRVCRLCPVF